MDSLKRKESDENVQEEKDVSEVSLSQLKERKSSVKRKKVVWEALSGWMKMTVYFYAKRMKCVHFYANEMCFDSGKFLSRNIHTYPWR